MAATRSVQAHAAQRRRPLVGAGASSRSTAPHRTKHNAALALMVAAPGTTLFMAGTSNSQPPSTTRPSKTVISPAARATSTPVAPALNARAATVVVLGGASTICLGPTTLSTDTEPSARY